MKRHRSLSTTVLFVVLLTLLGSPATAQQAEEAEAIAEEQSQEAPDEAETLRETVVVTASRFEQPLNEVPAAMTVIPFEEIENAPADDYGDILRNVPGLNVAQMSARDIQIAGRQATFSLSNTTLVLVDSRTLYLDFFGFVMWDLLPQNPREIRQVEVVRGPGSAVWGANALSGVINLITKSPWELQGTSVMVGGGELGTAYGSITHAGAGERLGYKLSAGYYEQDPYPRPSGLIPGTNTPYPPFENTGTSQPKADVRVDYHPNDQTRWTFSTGYGGTDGIIHSGIGPFDIDSGSGLGYGRAEWNRKALRVGFFANLLDGDADNLLTRGADGQPIGLGFETQTYNLDFSNTNAIGDWNLISYGANVRRNDFDLTIAPDADDRNEWGIYLQDEIFFGDHVRWLIGGRYDDIDPIDGVFSPRTSLMISPSPDHTFRLSYNEAFRAPSVIENYLDITIVNPILIPPIPGVTPGPIPYVFPSEAVGNRFATEEQLTSYEVGYVGNFGRRTTFTLAVYRTESKDGLDFYPSAAYTGSNPPPGWPLPPFFLDLPPFAGSLASEFSYRNIGEITNEGVEASFNMQQTPTFSWFVNYSYQPDPEVKGVDPNEVSKPPEHRANLGYTWNGSSFFSSATVNYVDDAFWTDVLDSRFWGPTDDYTMVNLTVGYRFSDSLAFSVIGQNIFDEEVQQHVFGDIITRKISGQLVFDF